MPHAVGRISEFGVVDAGPSTFFFHGCLISSVITKETAGPDTERGTSPDFGSVQRSFTGQHCFFLPLHAECLAIYRYIQPFFRIFARGCVKMQILTRTRRCVRMAKMQGAEAEGAGSVLKYMTKPECR